MPPPLLLLLPTLAVLGRVARCIRALERVAALWPLVPPLSFSRAFGALVAREASGGAVNARMTLLPLLLVLLTRRLLLLLLLLMMMVMLMVIVVAILLVAAAAAPPRQIPPRGHRRAH